MKVVGLDLSLTSTGVANANGETSLIKPKRLRGPERLQWVRDQVRPTVLDADLVVIEGYSFGSHNSRAHSIGELGGVIRLMLWEEGIPYIEVPPSTLKMYATGKGNAKKGGVLVAAVKRLGYGGSSDDEADALWLRQLGLHSLGHPQLELPQLHLRALEKLEPPIRA